MAISPATIVEYSLAVQRLELAPDRAQKVARELAPLVDGIFAIAGESAFADDPADFLATLSELRDTPAAGDE